MNCRKRIECVFVIQFTYLGKKNDSFQRYEINNLILMNNSYDYVYDRVWLMNKICFELVCE